MAAKLHDLGLLTEVDTAALAAYYVARPRWVQAEEALRKYGMIVISPSSRSQVQLVEPDPMEEILRRRGFRRSWAAHTHARA